MISRLQQNPSSASWTHATSRAFLPSANFLSLPPSFVNRTFPITIANEYSLFFANCAPETSVPMALPLPLQPPLPPPDPPPDGVAMAIGQRQLFSNFSRMGQELFSIFQLERKRFLGFISVTIAIIIAFQYYYQGLVFLLVDIICCYAIIFPIVWSIKYFRETFKIEGKATAYKYQHRKFSSWQNTWQKTWHCR